jgi:hypothetical protein
MSDGSGDVEDPQHVDPDRRAEPDLVSYSPAEQGLAKLTLGREMQVVAKVCLFGGHDYEFRPAIRVKEGEPRTYADYLALAASLRRAGPSSLNSHNPPRLRHECRIQR